MKPCHSSPPGAPCPCHEVGNWPEQCDCYHKSSDLEGALETMVLRLLIVAASLIVALLVYLLVVTTAHASPSCLTKAEARKQWPKAWLYWHTEHHCWDNRRGGDRYRHAPRYRDPVFGKAFAQDANGTVSTKKGDRLKFVTPDEFNELDAQLDDSAFFRVDPLPLWPPVLPLPLQQPPRFIPWEDRVTGALGGKQ